MTLFTRLPLQRPVRCCRARASGGEYDALVHQLLAAQHTQKSLHEFARQHKIVNSTKFLCHLRAREEAATDDEERARLWWLGSRLVALQDEAAYSEAVVPWTDQDLALLEAKATALRDSMAQNKAASTTALLGRKDVVGDVGDVGDAAARILDVLLDSDDRDWAALLPQAFEEGGGYDDEDDDTREMLSTTPLLLLQAIERRLSDGDTERLRALQRAVWGFVVVG